MAPTPPVPEISVSGNSRWGWGCLLLTGLGLLAFGQWLILADLTRISLGLVSAGAGVLLLAWLRWLPNKYLPWPQATLVGAILAGYVAVAYSASFLDHMEPKITVSLTLLGLLLVFTLFKPWKSAAIPMARMQPPAGQRTFKQWLLVSALVLLVMCLVIILAKKYLGFYDSSIDRTDFFRLRSTGGAFDIWSEPFKTWSKLWGVGTYLALLLAGHAYVHSRLAKWPDRRLLFFLYISATLSALSIAYLSAQGLQILPVQVQSENYAFFRIAKSVGHWPDLLRLLQTWPQRMLNLGLHTDTHPFGGVFLNWLLQHAVNTNPTGVALLLGALTWTGVIPVYLLGKALYSRQAGYYAAAIFTLLPNMLIFSYVSLDAFFATLVAWLAAGVVIWVGRREASLMFWPGVGAAVAGLLTFSAAQVIPILFVLAVLRLRDTAPPGTRWQAQLRLALPKALWFAAGIAAVYLFMQLLLQGKFDYATMMRQGMGTFGGQMRDRPWFIWFWLSPIQYFIHSGVAITALYCFRWYEIAKGAWRQDYWPWAGLILLLNVALSAFVHNEADRLYLFNTVFVVLTGTLALRPAMGEAQPTKETSSGQAWMFLGVLALSYVNAAAIEMLVVDYW